MISALKSHRAGLDQHGRITIRDESGHIALTNLNSHKHVQEEMLSMFGITSSGLAPTQHLTLPSFSSLSQLVHGEEAALWDLASILFDPASIFIADGTDDQRAYMIELDRMARLDQWLVRRLSELNTGLAAFPILSNLVLRNDLGGAASVAHAKGYPRLGAMLTLGHADPEFRQTCFQAQLRAWSQYSHRIPQEHLLIAQLLSGSFDEIEQYLSVSDDNWIIRLALRFWFGLAGRPADRLALALESVKPVADIRYDLMRLYLQMNYIMPGQGEIRVESCLTRNAFSSKWCLLDVTRVSWILNKMLSSSQSALLDSQLAEQLELAGSPSLALCLISSPRDQQALINRNIELLYSLPEMEPWSQQLMIAKAAYLASSNAPYLDQFSAFTAIQDWKMACHLLARYIGPTCILDGDEQTLYQCLGKLPAEVVENHPTVDRSIVAAIYGFISLRMQLQVIESSSPANTESLQHALLTAIDCIRSIPQSFLKDNLQVRVMISEISAALVSLNVPGCTIPSQSLPMSSSARIALAYQSTFY